ncbi:D-alanine--D-alanine ligase [compost metagenome]
MLVKNGIPYVLEVNTLPGMTGTSLLPRSALAAGYTFSGLLDEIISGSLAERRGMEAAVDKQALLGTRSMQVELTTRQGVINYV